MKKCLFFFNFLLFALGLSAQCTVGTMSTSNGMSMVTTCPGDGQADIVTFSSSAANSAQQTYVITDENFNILEITPNTSVDFENQAVGTCFIWGFS